MKPAARRNLGAQHLRLTSIDYPMLQHPNAGYENKLHGPPSPARML